MKRLTFIGIIRLLLDSKSWELTRRNTYLEEMKHNDGFRYFTNCGGCIRMYDDNFPFDNGRLIWPWEWLIIGPLGFINTIRVKRRTKTETS
jgi:hypothetical protein